MYDTQKKMPMLSADDALNIGTFLVILSYQIEN